MPRKLTVREYAIEKGISETAVRKQINRNQLRTTHEIINNRKTLLIIIEDGFEPDVEPLSSENQTGSEPIKDVEIIDTSSNYQLVSMEQSSFDNLIQSFNELSEKQAKALNEALKQTQTELFETRAELKSLLEENKKYIIDTAQAEANAKIKEIRNEELNRENLYLKEENKQLKLQNTDLVKEYEIIKEKLGLVESANRNKENFWTRKL